MEPLDDGRGVDGGLWPRVQRRGSSCAEAVDGDSDACERYLYGGFHVGLGHDPFGVGQETKVVSDEDVVLLVTQQVHLWTHHRKMTVVEAVVERGYAMARRSSCLGGSASQCEETEDDWGSRGVWSWHAARSGHADAGAEGADTQGIRQGMPVTTSVTTSMGSVRLNVREVQWQMTWCLSPMGELD